MAKRQTDEEKRIELEKVVEYGKKYHVYYTVKELLEKANSNSTYSQLADYTKKLHGKSLAEYLLNEHAIMSEEECEEYAHVLYQQVLEYSKGKPKIEALTLDEIEFADVDMDLLIKFWRDKDEPDRITLARRLALDGVLKMPFETQNEKKEVIDQAVMLTKSRIIQDSKYESHNLSGVTYYHEKSAFLRDVNFKLPKCDFFWRYGDGSLYEEAKIWIQELYSSDLRTFFVNRDLLCTKEELSPYFQEQIEVWKTIIEEKGKQKGLQELVEIRKQLQDEAYRNRKKHPRPAVQLALDKNVPSIDWMLEYVQEYELDSNSKEEATRFLTELFVNEGILQNEDEIREAASQKALKRDVYEDIDRYGFEILANLGITLSRPTGEGGGSRTKISGFPKDQTFMVNSNGRLFTVRYGMERETTRIFKDDQWKYDAYEAISTMSVPENYQDDWEDDYSESGNWDITWPVFQNDLKILPDDVIDRRKKFLLAVAALLETPEMALKIVEFAPKKKDGSFHRNRVVRIANSCLAGGWAFTLGIVGRIRADDELVISIGQLRERPRALETLKDDFINSNRDLFEFEKWC